jgi:subtilisin family serine protease
MRERNFLFINRLVLATLLGAVACGNKVDKAQSQTKITPAPSTNPEGEAKALAQSIQKQNENIIKENKLYRYPTLTTLLAVKDVNKTVRVINEAGATLVYDPNLGEGSQIPFLIASIPPKKLLDKKFIEDLDLRAMNISTGKVNRIEKMSAASDRAFSDNVFVPIDDIRIPELQKNYNAGADLGDNVTVAVIDSGVDASHPVFQNRVVYWTDQTEETQVALNPASISDGKINLNKKELKLPAGINESKEAFAGVISEESLGAQASFEEKQGETNPGLDLNQNGVLNDKFSVLIAYDDNKATYVAYIDLNGDGVIDGPAELEGIVDFNEKRAAHSEKLANAEEFVKFSARHQTIKYPLLIVKNAEGKPEALRLGMPSGSHGTHVSGIIAGNGLNVKGAAPKAKIMSIKVCSGITCTTDSILRGLVEAFYNPQGLVPDVVNISLGSQQQYEQDVMDYLMRDLSAKFGAVFVVSASNSGPGYRSLNSIASFGPTIQVGAHVSTRTLQKQYTLDPEVAKRMPYHNLLFFSSVGPSYTGHLRPNVIAPGSALSSTMLIDSGLEMYNGTSMSSPIVAGSVAALLSVAKKDPALVNVFKKKNEKISSIADEKNKNGHRLEYSLSGLAMAIRSGLENSAERLSQYTMAQEGHGLIQVDRAYPVMSALLGKWEKEEGRYFEVKLNNNEKDKRLYNREATLTAVKNIDVSIEEDPEMGENEKLSILSTPIQVRLEKVEIQSPNGQVQIQSDGFLPFAVGTPGLENQNASDSTLVLASRRKSFVSIRKLDQMKAGNTYLAHYTLSQNGIRVQSLLDVVHVPLHFSDAEQKITTPSLSPNGRNASQAQGFARVALAANTFHRYPIAIGENDTALNIELGVPPDTAGAMFLQVYDPDGNEIGDPVTAIRSVEIPKSTPTISRNIDTRNKKGIYEVLISSSTARWYGDSQYDLILSKERIKTNLESIKLKAGESKILSVVFINSKIDNASLKVEADGLSHIEEFMVDVLPGMWSYHQLNVPASTEEIHVSIPDDKSDNLTFFGSIVNKLFEDPENEEPKVVAQGSGFFASPSNVSFLDLDDVGSSAYMALETFSVIPESGTLKDASLKVPIEVIYNGESAGEIKTEILSEKSSTNLLIKVTAPEKLEGNARTEINISTGGKRLSIPVKVISSSQAQSTKTK